MRLQRIVPGLVAVALAASVARAAEGTPVFHADLNGDGQAETISLREVERDEWRATFVVEVRDAAGRLIWTSPAKGPEAERHYHFVEEDGAGGLPELVFDIDKDGRVEMLTPVPQSDVSPVIWSVLEWRDGAFRPDPRHGGSLLETRPGLFTWVRITEENFERYLPARFVMALHAGKRPGELIARAYRRANGECCLIGYPVLKAQGEGFALSGWFFPERDWPDDPMEADPAKQDCDGLWIMRNEIYARKGYCFRSRKARIIFSGSCAPRFEGLSAAEKRKVEQIRRLEEKKGCDH